MSGIIGRKKEIDELLELFRSDRAEFVAVYGRRRVGKTYLVDETLGRHLTFRHAGLSPIDDNGKQNMLKDQLQHFYHSLLSQGMKKSHQPTSWLEAFYMLEMHLQRIDKWKEHQLFLHPKGRPEPGSCRDSQHREEPHPQGIPHQHQRHPGAHPHAAQRGRSRQPEHYPSGSYQP